MLGGDPKPDNGIPPTKNKVVKNESSKDLLPMAKLAKNSFAGKTPSGVSMFSQFSPASPGSSSSSAGSEYQEKFRNLRCEVEKRSQDHAEASPKKLAPQSLKVKSWPPSDSGSDVTKGKPASSVVGGSKVRELMKKFNQNVSVEDTSSKSLAPVKKND